MRHATTIPTPVRFRSVPRAHLLPLALVFAAGACDDDKLANNAKNDAGMDGASGGAAGSPPGGGSGGSGGNGGAGGMPATADSDIVLARFKVDGTIDSSFGANGSGIVRVDLGAGVGNTRDALWNLASDASGRLVLFGSRKSQEPMRSDADRVVVRLTAEGALDQSFNKTGVHTLNVGNVGDSARTGFIQPDGKIFSSGYAAQPTGVGTQTANRVVLLRLLEDGTPDPMFGVAGVLNYTPFMSGMPTVSWGFAEAYGAGMLSDNTYVTTGYGRSDPALTTVNLISLKVSAAGVPISAYGTGGVLEKDIAGNHDRGRSMVVLPGDKTLMVGSTILAGTNIDAMLMMVTPAGALDTTFNTTGYKTYTFEDRPDEAFYSAAVAPNQMVAAAVGYRAGGDGNNDDAILVLLPLADAAPALEFAAAVPLSATANDRLWSVTFDADNRPVAAGFVSAGGDHQLAVARFNADGTPDTTFGIAGVATVNASVGGVLEEARGVVVLSDGSIVVAGVAEHL